MDLFSDLLPRRRQRQAERRLKRLLSAAGKVRELDILAENLKLLTTLDRRPLKRIVVRERQRALKKLQQITQQEFSKNRFRKLFRELPQRIRRDGKTARQPVVAWADESFRKCAGTVIQHYPIDVVELDALHEFRIHCKRLRYSTEFLTIVLRPEQQDRAQQFATDMQVLLGTIHDHQVNIDRLQRWQKKYTTDTYLQKLKQWRQLEQDRLREEIGVVHTLSTVEKRQELARQLLGE